jgi:RNA polymerase sigma-70 factor (ECF subfamily)
VGASHQPFVGDGATSTPLPIAQGPEKSGAIPVGTDWGQQSQQARLRGLVAEHLDFVWRSLRTLGVPSADCDDGCQKVWCVVAKKLALIQDGKERSFIFSVVVRVASDMRRSLAARRSVSLSGESGPGASDAPLLDLELMSEEPDVEELVDRQRARDVLERILSQMPWEQRVVFGMFEIEGLGLQEIADALAVPRGTVASRLRLAREVFNRCLARHQQKASRHERSLHAERTVPPPLPPDASSIRKSRPAGPSPRLAPAEPVSVERSSLERGAR